MVNPVVDRLEQLHGQWTAFVESGEARLLVWRAVDGEQALVDAFVAREGEDGASTPDLFVQLASPFRAARGHGFALVNELLEQYEQAVVEQERWRCPAVTAAEDDIQALLRVLLSFHHHHLSAPSKLAVWLQSDVEPAYLLWLQRLVHAAPDEVRFLIVSADDALAPLVERERMRVVQQACELDVPAALEELALAAKDETPGSEFRVLQTRCGKQLAAGDLAAAKVTAQSAVQFAKAQGWPHLAAIVKLMLASALSAQGEPNDALATYAEAEALGAEREQREAKDLTEPACGTRIRMQARLGQGALLLSCSAYKLAAATYEEAAELAHRLADGAELDALRLASLCRSQLGEASSAWELALRGLRVGLAMDDDMRTMLPYLAQHMVRLTERDGEYASQRRALEDTFARALGTSWRDALVPGS